MKKNMLTIVVIAIGVVNLVMTALLVFIALPTFNKTGKLMTQVANMIDLELAYEDGTPVNVNPDIPLDKTESLALGEEELTINLKEPNSWVMLKPTLTIHKKAEKYKKIRPKVDENLSAMKEIVTRCFNQRTREELEGGDAALDELKKEILVEFEALFGTRIIVNISFGNIKYESI